MSKEPAKLTRREFLQRTPPVALCMFPLFARAGEILGARFESFGEFHLENYLNLENTLWYWGLDGATQYWLRRIMYEYATFYKKIHSTDRVGKTIRRFMRIMSKFAPDGFRLSGSAPGDPQTRVGEKISASISYEGDVPSIEFGGVSAYDNPERNLEEDTISAWDAYVRMVFLSGEETILGKFIHEFAHIIYNEFAKKFKIENETSVCEKYFENQNETIQENVIAKITQDARLGSKTKSKLYLRAMYNYIPYKEAVTHRIIVPVLVMKTLLDDGDGRNVSKKIMDYTRRIFQFALEFAQSSDESAFARCSIGTTIPYIIAPLMFDDAVIPDRSIRARIFRYSKVVLPALEKFYGEFYPEIFYGGTVLLPIYNLATKKYPLITEKSYRMVAEMVELATILKRGEPLDALPDYEKDKLDYHKEILSGETGVEEYRYIPELLPKEIRDVYSFTER